MKSHDEMAWHEIRALLDAARGNHTPTSGSFALMEDIDVLAYVESPWGDALPETVVIPQVGHHHDGRVSRW